MAFTKLMSAAAQFASTPAVTVASQLGCSAAGSCPQHDISDAQFVPIEPLLDDELLLDELVLMLPHSLTQLACWHAAPADSAVTHAALRCALQASLHVVSPHWQAPSQVRSEEQALQ